MPETPAPLYSLLVSNVGWVYNNHPDYDFILKEFEWYKNSGDYDQVTMWSSEEDDPIEEFYLPEQQEEILPMAPED